MTKLPGIERQQDSSSVFSPSSYFYANGPELLMEQCLAASVTHFIVAPLNGHYDQSSFQHLLATPKARLKDILKRIFLKKLITPFSFIR